eukprot:1141906-Pelagomonas_calceolata.AAC.5
MEPLTLAIAILLGNISGAFERHEPASMLLLETLGFKKLGKSDGGVVLSKVELDGWNTSDMKAEDLLPLEDWRDLKPRLIGRQYSHPPSF